VIADDGLVPSPANSNLNKPVSVSFIPVPYRQSVQTTPLVRVAIHTVESVKERPETPSASPQQITMFGAVRRAVLTRIAQHKTSQGRHRLVPEPQDLEARDLKPVIAGPTAKRKADKPVLRDSTSQPEWGGPLHSFSASRIRVFK
jgi:hypothetical protein